MQSTFLIPRCRFGRATRKSKMKVKKKYEVGGGEKIPDEGGEG
jgi:hypothetical protein